MSLTPPGPAQASLVQLWVTAGLTLPPGDRPDPDRPRFLFLQLGHIGLQCPDRANNQEPFPNVETSFLGGGTFPAFLYITLKKPNHSDSSRTEAGPKSRLI